MQFFLYRCNSFNISSYDIDEDARFKNELKNRFNDDGTIYCNVKNLEGHYLTDIHQEIIRLANSRTRDDYLRALSTIHCTSMLGSRAIQRIHDLLPSAPQNKNVGETDRQFVARISRPHSSY